jgi:hypothetical protein
LRSLKSTPGQAKPIKALQLIDRSLSTPNGVTVAMLKLDPMWDPLGTDPRFQRLVALQAPSNTMP